jgi:hypothetical protein
MDDMTELKPWERRLALWMDRHPRAADRIDQIIENSADYPGAATMAIFILPSCYILALAALIVALILGHPWNWIAGAFIANALFFSAAAVYLFFEDRRVARRLRQHA